MTEMTRQWRAQKRQVSNSGLSVLRQTGSVLALTKMLTGAEATNAAENIPPLFFRRLHASAALPAKREGKQEANKARLRVGIQIKLFLCGGRVGEREGCFTMQRTQLLLFLNND